ncbi:MAG TPA: hypothetical protein DDZ41_05380, partial [Flavobacterium sp.]|nr:hypothetical protein [Flavobacterium sp.]
MLIFLTILLFFTLFQNLSFNSSISVNIIKSILSFGFTTYVITELLSLMNNLNLYGIIISWLIVSIILIFLIFKTKSKIDLFCFFKKIKCFTVTQKIYFIIICLIFLLILFQGIIYPPNNWDSLTYHMSRIMYWLGNENLNHFPTHILRHLYQPPFAEYIIMHVNVLQGNDYFSNSIQLLFLVFCLFPLNEILNVFRIGRSSKLISFLFCITTPSVLLQASTTKNDIVCAFFILTSILFLYKCYKESTLSNYLFLGISIGLGMLTKGTFYLFLFPALLIFLLFLGKQMLFEKKFKPILYGLLSIFILSIINIGHFSRNYAINNHVLSIDDVENNMYSNEEMNFTFFSSNLMKNIGLHMGYPFNSIYEDFILNIHKKIDVSIDEPKLNFLGTKYNTKKSIDTNEDLVPNSFHLMIILIASFVIIVNSICKKKYTELILLIIVIFQVFFFCLYLKWQPWHTRLHIPIFILSSAFIGLIHNDLKRFSFLKYLIIFLFANFTFYFIYNNTRPIITNTKYTKKIYIEDSRYKKYFSNQLYLYPEYYSIQAKMDEINVK